MKPVVKYIFSSDVDNLESYTPENDSIFCIQMRAIVGPDSGEGEESVDFEVCTLEWLKQEYGTENIISGRDKLIIFKYNYKKIKAKITELLESCEGETWESCGNQMAKYGLWEFENYKQYDGH